MNQKPTPERLAYRQKQLAELDKVLPALAPEIRRRTEDPRGLTTRRATRRCDRAPHTQEPHA